MSRLQLLLAAGIAVPVLYFATVFGTPLASPGYSHLTQYASELGMAGSPSARWFNAGIFLTGLAAIVASPGMYLAARRDGAGRLWPALAALSLGLFGVGLMLGALFPMPDPRHGGFGLGMGIHLAPLFLALALWRVTGRRRLARLLLAAAILMLALLLPMMGVGGLVTTANVGLFQRLYALAVFGWIGVAGYALSKPRAS